MMMEFFSKFLEGEDTTSSVIAVVKHLQEIQKFIGDREQFIQYFNKNKMQYSYESYFGGDDVVYLHWTFKISEMIDLKLCETKIFTNAESFVTGRFISKKTNNPLEPITLNINKDKISYDIAYPWREENRPMQNYCKSFLENLNSHDIYARMY